MFTQSVQTTHPLFWLPVSKALLSLIAWSPEATPSGFLSKPDIFRQLPLRFIGYGVPLGEALHFPDSSSDIDPAEPFFLLGYSYILAHCVYVAVDVYKNETSGRAVIAFLDTLFWEYLASCLYPTFITLHVCRLTDGLLSIAFERASTVRRVIPVLAGIAILPLIVISVDSFVDRIMSERLRPLYSP